MKFLKRLAGLLRRSPIDREIDDELLSHLEMRTADNMADGMTELEARRAARLRFGNPLVLKEKVQSVELALGAEDFVADLRYALRGCLRNPGFTALAALPTMVLLSSRCRSEMRTGCLESSSISLAVPQATRSSSFHGRSTAISGIIVVHFQMSLRRAGSFPCLQTFPEMPPIPRQPYMPRSSQQTTSLVSSKAALLEGYLLLTRTILAQNQSWY